LDALAIEPKFKGEVELLDNLIKMDYFECYRYDKKALTKS
ncbi:TPA: EbsA protein, partial [Streptococcus agalactiae]|nr:EbsA protein [Streptococcus agalactiae]